MALSLKSVNNSMPLSAFKSIIADQRNKLDLASFQMDETFSLIFENSFTSQSQETEYLTAQSSIREFGSTIKESNRAIGPVCGSSELFQDSLHLSSYDLHETQISTQSHNSTSVYQTASLSESSSVTPTKAERNHLTQESPRQADNKFVIRPSMILSNNFNENCQGIKLEDDLVSSEAVTRSLAITLALLQQQDKENEPVRSVYYTPTSSTSDSKLSNESRCSASFNCSESKRRNKFQPDKETKPVLPIFYTPTSTNDLTEESCCSTNPNYSESKCIDKSQEQDSSDILADAQKFMGTQEDASTIADSYDDAVAEQSRRVDDQAESGTGVLTDEGISQGQYRQFCTGVKCVYQSTQISPSRQTDGNCPVATHSQQNPDCPDSNIEDNEVVNMSPNCSGCVSSEFFNCCSATQSFFKSVSEKPTDDFRRYVHDFFQRSKIETAFNLKKHTETYPFVL